MGVSRSLGRRSYDVRWIILVINRTIVWFDLVRMSLFDEYGYERDIGLAKRHRTFLLTPLLFFSN